MPARLNEEELQEIAEQLAEYVAGYAGFMSWARGEIERVEAESDLSDFPWRAPFLLFAGKGRVQVYRHILRSHKFEIDPFTEKTIDATNEDLENWLEDTYNEVASDFEDAGRYLLQVYKSSYQGLEKNQGGWSFDDFIEERDLLEFFLIGAEDRFDLTELAVSLFEHDCKVRDHIAELGLEQYAEEYFPGRIGWYPPRFWWHHPPEERAPHPDSLES
jgi:hypothetical protein